MKIALDVMGGDNAPDINVDGAKRALQDFSLIEKSILWEGKKRCATLVTAGGFPARAWKLFLLRKLWK